MKRKILTGVLLGLIFLLWLVCPAQGREIITIHEEKVQSKLNPKQKEVKQVLTEGILKGFLEVFNEQEKRRIKFKKGELHLEIKGDYQKGDLVIKMDLLIHEPDGSTWTLKEKQVWEKCPEPDSPEVTKTINLLKEIAILNFTIEPSQSLPKTLLHKMPISDI